jgi:hypothetical protein
MTDTKHTPSVVFYNDGALDVRAITTFGLSAKESANPIGYFGTGLKYAIAVLIREGCDISIITNGAYYSFRSVHDNFRGQDCDLLFMDKDGEEYCQLPFTLSLGRNWALWQAYRELYCNALDEGGGCRLERGTEDTQISVCGNKFASVHDNRNSFINDDTPIASYGGVDIVSTPGVFLKSIRVSDGIYRPTLFGYKFQGGITLTEDRTLKNHSDAERLIMNAVAQFDQYDLICSFLTAQDGTFEEQIAWEHLSCVGNVFARALSDMMKSRKNDLSRSAQALARRLNPAIDRGERLMLTPTQEMAYKTATKFLSRRGVSVDDFPVEFVTTLGDGIWGQAKNGKILISKACFDYGTKCLVATLYEEHLHLSKGFDDCCREMQNHLFHTIVGLWEDAEGVSL